MLFSSKKQLLSAKCKGGRRGPRTPMAVLSRPMAVSTSAVAKSLDLEHGWQILQFPV